MILASHMCNAIGHLHGSAPPSDYGIDSDELVKEENADLFAANIARTSKDNEIIIEILPNVPLAPEEFQPIFLENEEDRECLVNGITEQMEETIQMMAYFRDMMEYIAKVQCVKIDESGLLQSGQVFFRYAVDSFDKLSQVVSDKQIYRRKVLITKNPAVVSGDVRNSEAVDCVALRHLCEVVCSYFWAEKHELKINIINFYALLLCISNGMIYPDIGEFTPWLEPVDFIHAPTHQIDLTGNAALTTYYHLSLTDTKFVLPQSSSTQSDAVFSPIVEGPPPVLEIPISMVSKSLDALRKRAKIFGCVHLASRAKTVEYAKDILQQIRAFYDSISVIPKDSPSAQEQYNDMT
uniref:RNA-dependent RNA polymerase n=1 Tax=Panagrolaimus davidi TaxID=227884 RepID=A0A914QMY7_9BILA